MTNLTNSKGSSAKEGLSDYRIHQNPMFDHHFLVGIAILNHISIFLGKLCSTRWEVGVPGSLISPGKPPTRNMALEFFDRWGGDLERKTL